MSGLFCAPLNAPGAVSAEAGYRLLNRYGASVDAQRPPDPSAPRDPFVALTFSGGGTRAAALSYGVLEALRDADIPARGDKTRLLDCVELISSASGGSFTAARYAQIGDDIFAEGSQGFRARMLYANLNARLAATVLAPWNVVRMLSPYFDRADLAAEVYQRFFGKATYADLAPGAAPALQGRRSKPFIALNATNMSLGARFEFTQDQFDLIGSAIDGFPIARAVAASSAFPVAFTPLTLANYGPPRTVNMIPYQEGAKDADENLARFRESVVALEYEKTQAHPFVHLLDGGLADNTGARMILASLRNDTGALKRLLRNGAIDTLAIVMVNAKTSLDRCRRAPGIVNVLFATGSVAMDNYGDDSVSYIDGWLRDLAASYQRKYADLAGRPWVDDPQPDQAAAIRFPVVVPCPDGRWVRVVSAYVVHVSFDALAEPDRSEMLAVPTSFTLGEPRASKVSRIGAKLLGDSPEYQAFLAKVRAPKGDALVKL